jgi:hypothetical protein
MNDRPSHNLDGLDIEMARRIDEVCHRFEADWREGRRPRIEDSLLEVPHEQATVPAGNPPRSPHEGPTVAVLGQAPNQD